MSRRTLARWRSPGEVSSAIPLFEFGLQLRQLQRDGRIFDGKAAIGPRNAPGQIDEPLDLLDGIRRVVVQLESGRASVENAYARVVCDKGNVTAQSVINEVFECTDRAWRGMGTIPRSGWRLRDAFSEFDAEVRFDVEDIHTCESDQCRAGDVLQGALKPHQCEAFGIECTPRTPLGAPMVSSEGACAAYYHYGRFEQLNAPNRPS